MRLSSVLCALVLLLTACAASHPSAAPDGTVQLGGRVYLRGTPEKGISVEAWPVDTASLVGKAPFRSGTSDKDGNFSLPIPAGDYYLFARGRNLFAYYGRNPLNIPPSGLSDLKIGLVEFPPPPQPPQEVGIDSGISGEIRLDGAPLGGAIVYAYTDLSSSLKGMGYAMSAPSDSSGRFELALPAGTYYLLARLRQNGGMTTGPLRAGDLIGYAPVNPVKVTDNRVSLVSIPLLKVPDKVDQLGDSLFGQTALRGQILDRDGRPLAGLRAALYSESQMLNRPLYVSQPTGADGTFVLSFPSGGTYYLAARQQLGGAPAPGELYGTYDGTPDHAVQIKTGEHLGGLQIVVEPMW